MRPNELQLAKINSFSLDRKFTADEVEVFKALLVDTKPTSYNSILQQGIKDKFVADLNAGKTALNLLHASEAILPVGKSFDGYIEDGVVYGFFYLVKGTKAVGTFNTVEVNDVISNIQTGVYENVSVEFRCEMEDYKCSICGNDYYSWDCEHVAGKKYVTEDEGLDKIETCYVLIDNRSGKARLGALSLVVTGAVTDASFVPIQVPSEVEQIASGFSVATAADDKHRFIFKPGANKYVRAESFEIGGNMEKDLATLVEQLAATSSKLGAAEAEISTYKSKIEALEKEVAEYKASNDSILEQAKTDEAKLGAYEASEKALREKAKEFGIKAYGEAFDEEKFNEMSVEEVVKYMSEAVDKFIETFPAGKLTAGEGEATPVVSAVNVFKA